MVGQKRKHEVLNVNTAIKTAHHARAPKLRKLQKEVGIIHPGLTNAPEHVPKDRQQKKEEDAKALEDFVNRKQSDFQRSNNRRFSWGIDRNSSRDVPVFRDCLGTFGLADMTEDLILGSVTGQAKQAGLRACDVITHVDGIAVHNIESFKLAVSGKDHKCVFTVLRNDKTTIWKCEKAEGVAYRSKREIGAKVEDEAGPTGGSEIEVIREVDGWLQVPHGYWLPIVLKNPAGEETVLFSQKEDVFQSLVWDLKQPLGVQLYFPVDGSAPQVKDVTNRKGLLGAVATPGHKIVQVGEWELAGIEKKQFDQLIFEYKEERYPLDIVLRKNIEVRTDRMIIPPSWNSGSYGCFLVPEMEQSLDPNANHLATLKAHNPQLPEVQAPIHLDRGKRPMNKKTPSTVTIKSETEKKTEAAAAAGALKPMASLKKPIEHNGTWILSEDECTVNTAKLTEAQKKIVEEAGDNLPKMEKIPDDDRKDSDATSMDLYFNRGDLSICLCCMSVVRRSHWDIHVNGFKHERAFKQCPIRRKKVEKTEKPKSRERSRKRSRTRSRDRRRRERDRRARRRTPPRSRRRDRRSRSRRRRRSRSRDRRKRSRSRSRKKRSRSASLSASKALKMSLDDIGSKRKRKRSRSSDKKKKKKKSRARSESSKSSSPEKKKKKKKKKSPSPSPSPEPEKKKKKKKKKKEVVASESESEAAPPPKKKQKKSKGKQPGVFNIGDKVALVNLRSTPQFNGAIGEITDKAENDRWPVKITEPERKHFAIKAKNLEHYDPAKHPGVAKKTEKKKGTQPVGFIGEWFVYKKGDLKYYYNSRTKKTTWTRPEGDERPMGEFKK